MIDKILAFFGLERMTKQAERDEHIQALEYRSSRLIEMLKEAENENVMLRKNIAATQGALDYEITYANQVKEESDKAKFLMVQRELIHDYAHRKLGCQHVSAAALAVMIDREAYKRSLH